MWLKLILLSHQSHSKTVKVNLPAFFFKELENVLNGIFSWEIAGVEPRTLQPWMDLANDLTTPRPKMVMSQVTSFGIRVLIIRSSAALTWPQNIIFFKSTSSLTHCFKKVTLSSSPPPPPKKSSPTQRRTSNFYHPWLLIAKNASVPFRAILMTGEFSSKKCWKMGWPGNSNKTLI